MSLIKKETSRDTSPSRSSTSRANSRRSTGPRSARGKAISSRNAVKPRLFSQLVARSMEALGERPEEFERTHQALSSALAPRDAWEPAWVQDLAILRWRLEHVRRAEMGMVALRRRRVEAQRRRAASPPTGSAGLELNNMVGIVGFTGIPDSVMKFQQVIEYFTQLRDLIQASAFEHDISPYITILYGKTPGPQATLLKAHYDTLANYYKTTGFEAAMEDQKSLLADLNKEIERYERQQALYHAECVDADPVQQDAELLLPTEDLDDMIRYETHLEDQIERKLRQFYARRRESVLRPTSSGPETVAESEAGALACQ